MTSVLTIRDMQEDRSGSPDIGARLKKAREAAGMTQRDVLGALGRELYNNSWLSNKETGKRGVSAEDIAIFARLYRVSADYLLNVEAAGPENLLARLGTISDQLWSIPVLDLEGRDGFASGEIKEYAYQRPPPSAASKNLVGIRVSRDWILPEIQTGYFIIVDREKDPVGADFIVASDGEEPLVARLDARRGEVVAVNVDGAFPIEALRIEGVIVQISRDL